MRARFKLQEDEVGEGGVLSILSSAGSFERVSADRGTHTDK